MNMMKKYMAALMAIVLFAACMPALAEIESFSIAQIYQEFEDDTRLHIRLESTGAVSGHAQPLSVASIAEATIGTGDTPVMSVTSVKDSVFEGMTYVFVLDHAMSISNKRVTELKDGMNNWIDAMSDKDCAAIVVAEEEEIRVLTDGFVSDKAVLKAAVEDYGKGDEKPGKNMIFSAIREGILMASTDAPSRPRNTCIVVCSNGADTYQTLVTGEEISSLLSENNLPMYVVGFAYSNYKDSLAALVSMAKSSGGWSEDATPSNDQGTIEEAFDRLRQRISAGYDVEIDCSDGFVFNGPTLVSLRLSDPQVLIKRTADLYLLDKDEDETPAPAAKPTAKPVAKPTVKPAEKPAANQDDPGAAAPEENPEQTEGSVLDTALAWLEENPKAVIGAGAAAAVIVLLIIISSIAKRGRRRENEIKAETDKSEDTTVKSSSQHKAQQAAAGETGEETMRVRAAAQAAPQAAAPAARYENDNRMETVRMRGTQVQSFVPRQTEETGVIARLRIRYTVPGQAECERVFTNPLEVSIGREPGNTLTIDYECLSSRHALITCEGSRVYIANVSKMRNGEQNELYVNRILIQEKTELRKGCRLNIGMIPMVVDWTLDAPGAQEQDEDHTVRRRPQEDDDATVRIRPMELSVRWSIRGMEGSSRVMLTGQATVGRDARDTVCIEDVEKSVSKHHLILIRTGRSIVLRNGSREDPVEGKNPFYYNGNGIVDEIPFENGMTVYLGDARVTLELGKM